MKSVLGTGLSGLVGSKIVEVLGGEFSFLNLDLTNKVDILDIKTVERAISQSDADTLIHMAAFTNVDAAFEQEGDTNGVCYRVNVLGTDNIARVAKEYGKHLIHISTAFVFDGENEGMYVEEDAVSPIEWYGKTKAMAEEVVQKQSDSWTLFRIDQPFRSDPFAKPDTAHKLLDKLKTGSIYPLFTDHWFSPTSIEDFAEVLRWAVEHKPQGIFHATCNQKISDYEYGQMIAKTHEIECEIPQGSLVEYKKTLKRPYQTNTAMSSDKLIRESGLKPAVLKERIAQIL